MHKIFSILVLLLISNYIYSDSKTPEFLKGNTQWADSVLSKMTLNEKIGQLIMVTTYPSQGNANDRQIESWIKNQHIGGVLYLRTSPYLLASTANKYQTVSKIPLFIALDAENGLSFRLDSVVEYPYAIGLGSIANDSLLYQMGREIGQQCKMLGVNLNFAPVVDVNSNPKNPVINYRSFGESASNVSRKSWLLASGMQDESVFVTAKHFPGHGNTSYDSHLTLPVIKKNYAFLDSVDFLPFKTCISNGINGIMTAHINMSKLDKSGLPATLSPKIMTDILRDSLSFDGLIFSDGMNMKGITAHFSEGDAAVKALLAGVDVIEFVVNPKLVIQSIRKAINDGLISENLINDKCLKVLRAKAWCGLEKYQAANLSTLHKDLKNKQYLVTTKKLFQESITVIQNADNLIPLQRLDTLKVASLSIGNGNNTFQKSLDKYMEIEHFYIDINASSNELDVILKQIKNYNLVVAGVYGTRLSISKSYSVREMHKIAINKLLKQNKTILTFFSNPYALKQFSDIEKAESVIVTYGENDNGQSYAAQLIFGAIGTKSRLPVTIDGRYKSGDGFTIKEIDRLKYTMAEETGIDSNLLKSKIDSFATYGIKERIFPGCQLLVAKEGKVIFHESYGYHTYDSITFVRNDAIYDWASLTKITGPLPILMKMVQDSIIKLDEPLSNYWIDLKNTDKENITFREVLAHQARLKPWIAFYLDVYNKKRNYRKKIIRDRPSLNYPIRVSSSLYIHKNYKEKIYDEIKESELLKRKKYTYSGLAFYLFPELISNILEVNYEYFLKERFLNPLGASTVMYNPYKRFQKNDFIPTELDNVFRKELLQGFVHDEGAAMMGGVSGNAGLFGSTNDLAKIMQFYLLNGKYGDFDFLNSKTINEFTRMQYPDNENRRGLGFDKPYIDNRESKMEDAYPAIAVSSESFGHSGYTGTFAWADPENQLIFIFMSNRVYPTRENTKLYDLNFRPKLQQAVYDCQNSFNYNQY